MLYRHLFEHQSCSSILIIGTCYCLAFQHANEIIETNTDFHRFFDERQYQELEDTVEDTVSDGCFKLFTIYFLEQLFYKVYAKPVPMDDGSELSLVLSYKSIFVTKIFQHFANSSFLI
jgi:hypothetical protein